MDDDDYIIPYSQTNSYSLSVVGSAKSAKTFNDPVHGHFRLGGATIAVIDTPDYQRLRWLKQLGLTYYVFPGAAHNRFEHSLGVAHLGAHWASILKRQDPGLGIDEIDITLVELAGGWV
jgi:HD superfamily phosphohydrolase